jgi:predicted nucleotidyltransferase
MRILSSAMPEPVPGRLDDPAFLASMTRALSGLPGVRAVMLGGSRAYGQPDPDSDWDFSIYYRGHFDVGQVRALGWPGQVSAIGGWGGGVFNGGAWLTVEGRRVDIHYRDLEDVERRIGEAERGEFAVEPLLNYLAGLPTYVVVAELALGRVLGGDLPRPDYPEALRRSAARIWRERAAMTLAYARKAYAGRGQLAMTLGAAARALLEAGHGRLAAGGIWITNEKTLLARAGWERADALFAAAGTGPGAFFDRIEEWIFQ